MNNVHLFSFKTMAPFLACFPLFLFRQCVHVSLSSPHDAILVLVFTRSLLSPFFFSLFFFRFLISCHRTPRLTCTRFLVGRHAQRRVHDRYALDAGLRPRRTRRVERRVPIPIPRKRPRILETCHPSSKSARRPGTCYSRRRSRPQYSNDTPTTRCMAILRCGSTRTRGCWPMFGRWDVSARGSC